jgi:FixJ family two-component response regulator
MGNLAAWPVRLLSPYAAHFGNASPLSGILSYEETSVLPIVWSGKAMTEARVLVSVVDDDESVRESLPDLLQELGFAARIFSSAEEFLDSRTPWETECLILDVAMPGMSGPELQLELKRRAMNIPVVFITARRDEAVRRQLLERGAVECLLKPFSDTALLDALNAAVRPK